MVETSESLSIYPVVLNIAIILGQHLLLKSRMGISLHLYYAVMLAYALTTGLFVVKFISLPKVGYAELVVGTFSYAAFLFVAISEVLLAGFASVLTRLRGEKWAKELDYIYLVLGACGLAMSINRLEIVGEKLSMPEVYGPFVLATALVIRAIKTRVEINDWNKVKPPAELPSWA